LIQFKTDLPDVKNFGIKYGWKGLDLRNSFSYWNFSRFRREFELKFREDLMIQN
jgi:hypothetical protein